MARRDRDVLQGMQTADVDIAAFMTMSAKTPKESPNGFV
jgi:hypothetical protein